MDDDTYFACNMSLPGIGCGYPEFIALASLFYIAAIVALFFLFKHIKSSKGTCKFIDQTFFFWFFMFTWQVYKGTIHMFKFNWDPQTFLMYNASLNHVLYFIPMCLVILILFNLLFSYRNPGLNAIVFFRALLSLFLITYVVIGIIIIRVTSAEGKDPDQRLGLWCFCTDFILLLFFVIPAKALLNAVTYPMVQPDDVKCVNFCKIGLILYSLLMSLRMLWNFSHFFRFNKVQDYFYNNTTDWKYRLWSWFFFFMFDYMISVLAMISVYLFKKHDLMFNENPYYNRQDF